MSEQAGAGGAPEQHSRGAVGRRQGRSPFPIVGVGASAGGLEAYQRLLGRLPSDGGIAFLLVQHLDPHHESRLADLLANTTAMPVVEGTHGLAVRPDHVYVIPPNSTMTIADGVLQITERPKSRTPHLPVDALFRSLAEDQQSRSIGIVLSGTGADGTLGLCEIKAVGGITLAQEASSAMHSGMPHSAVAGGCVDFVLSPEEIADRLVQIVQHPYVRGGTAAAEPSDQDRDFRRLLAIVRATSGVDFSLYRNSTLRRRILRRMALMRLNSLPEYVQHLEEDRKEAAALHDDLLINVTSFFRDPAAFEALKEVVFPQIAEAKGPSDTWRIWVPGCSSGQEAYSLAMLLTEFHEERGTRPRMQVFATDLTDQGALDKGRAGLYPESIEGEVPPARLRRFFTREGDLYRIDKSLRDSCVFAVHNVTSDPPFSHLELISCRNVLIYLTTPLQKRIVPTFHYALNVPGFLLLGSAETVGEHGELFEAVDRANRIYAKRPGPSRAVLFGREDQRLSPVPGERRAPRRSATLADHQREVDRLLLGRFAPPGVVVDEDFEVVQFRGRTSPYLEAPPGEPTTNVLKLARQGLFAELRSALTEALGQQQPVLRQGVRVHADGVEEIDLEVVPLRSSTSPRRHFLVLFKPPGEPPAKPAAAAGRKAASGGPPSERPDAAGAAAEREIAHLRQELAATKEFLQSLIEQQDAANEELRSSNEEILSSNEELQSTNEELQTAKEELQSTNEELSTVNEQLQVRNTELGRANDDLRNLLSSVDIPLVMVGGDLRIRRFNAPAGRALNLMESDLGRLVGDIAFAVELANLEPLVREVIETVRPVTREVRHRDGRWHTLRVYPYRTSDRGVEGAVIVLVDVDDLRRARDELAQQAAQLAQQASLQELSRDAISVRDASDRILSWNRGAQEMYGWTAEEALGRRLDELLGVDREAWAEMNARLEADGTWEGELRHTRRDGTRLLVDTREALLRDGSGARKRVLAIGRDVTERQQMLALLREADRRKDSFLATLAHELRNPIAPIRNALELMHRIGDGDRDALGQVRGVLQRQVQQLSRIIEDLVDVSRIVERKLVLHLERVELSRVVQTAVESCRAEIEARNHRLEVHLPAEAIVLDADPVRLTQVLVNLLTNAARYSEPGGWIRLDVAGEDGQARMTVSDSGMGIPSGLLPHVFEMFRQGGPPGSSAGLGVGLTLVRSIVEMHGGTVDAESDGSGCGSTFTVRLPLASSTAGMAPTTLDVPPPRIAGELDVRRVLVVDDNADQARTLGQLIELLGHEVRTAEDGQGALAEARTFRPHAALVDIGLPGMSGHELASELRAVPGLGEMLLIAQTGWGREEDRVRSREAGFDHHLVKPVDLEVLRTILGGAPAPPPPPPKQQQPPSSEPAD